MMLRAEGLTKAFDKFIAVNEVGFAIPEGQLTAIIGPNGAGKTTLINLLTGRLAPDKGHIYFHDEDITDLSASKRVQRGIGRSFQLVNIFPRLTVRENLTIPVLSRTGSSRDLIHHLSGFKDVHNHVDHILYEVGLETSAELLAGQLSHGDQHLLEIALALATEPTLLILDEPTAGMNLKERQRLLTQLEKLVKSGSVNLMLVEHDMDVVFALADRIIVLDQGNLLVEGTPAEIQNNHKVREIYLGSDLEGSQSHRQAQQKPSTGEKLIEVENIDTFYGMSQALHSVSIDVNRGEAVALLGRNGVGKTTTLRSITGLTPPRRGAIRLRGEIISGLPPYEIAALGVGFVPEGSRIFPNLSTMQNLQMPAQVIKKKDRRWTIEKVEEVFPPLQELRERKGRYLSGGERKMLAVGRALMADAEILLLDEPSEGLSPLMVRFLLDALIRLREEGITILLADQNLKFAYQLADRAYILDKGAVAYYGTLADLRGKEEIVKKYLAV